MSQVFKLFDLLYVFLMTREAHLVIAQSRLPLRRVRRRYQRRRHQRRRHQRRRHHH